MTTTSNPFGDEPLRGSGLRPIYQVVYCSRASEGVDGEAVDRIIKSSHRLNPARGITGLLVFGSGIFFQWLEGPRDSVLELMDVLRGDTRHQDVVMLAETEELRERLFPDWSMELVDATDIREVLLDAQSTTQDPRSAEALTSLLEQMDSGLLGALGR
jgi:hypothetical protein